MRYSASGELHKRVEQYKRDLAKAESSTNEVDESLKKSIEEKDALIKKLKITSPVKKNDIFFRIYLNIFMNV